MLFFLNILYMYKLSRYLSKTINPTRYSHRGLKSICINGCDETIYEKEDNWGSVKGGIVSSKILKNLSPELLQKKKLIGKKIGSQNLKKLKKKYGINFYHMAVNGKLKKRKLEIKKLENKNSFFFSNEIVNFDTSRIKFSKNDLDRNIILPTYLTSELSEEIGAHVGDGTLSNKKYYFSIRCDKNEKGYFTNFLFRLYKDLFNIDLNLLERGSISGFELSSKAIHSFKENVLGLTVGKKVDKIDVPSCILESKNLDIYSSFLRGVFDTDGCITFRKNNYPIILISIKSENLIKNICFMLSKLGYTFYTSKYNVTLNGYVVVQKWINEIGSHNPKHLGKFEKANRIIGQYAALRS